MSGCTALGTQAASDVAEDTLSKHESIVKLKLEAAKYVIDSCESDLCRVIVVQEVMQAVKDLPEVRSSFLKEVLQEIGDILGVAIPAYLIKEVSET